MFLISGKVVIKIDVYFLGFYFIKICIIESLDGNKF